MATSDSHPEFGVYVPNVTLAVARGAQTVAPETIVFDGFESGDFSSPAYPDFSWGGSGDGTTLFVGSTPTYPAKTGNHCMVVRYPAGQNFLEQQFTLASPGVHDVWMSFDMRVPVNFFHNTQDSTSQENNKFWRLWCNDYSGNTDPANGVKVGMSFRPIGDGTGSSYWFCKIFHNLDGIGSGGDIGSNLFIRVPEDRGRWMSLVFHIKLSSDLYVADGSFEVWRKWEGESVFTKEYELLNEYLPPGGVGYPNQGFSNADFMGYANSPYTEDTEFLFDNFELSRTDPRGVV